MIFTTIKMLTQKTHIRTVVKNHIQPLSKHRNSPLWVTSLHCIIINIMLLLTGLEYMKTEKNGKSVNNIHSASILTLQTS